MTIDLHFTPQTKQSPPQGLKAEGGTGKGEKADAAAFFALLRGFAQGDQDALNTLLSDEKTLERIQKTILEINSLISNDNIKLDEDFFAQFEGELTEEDLQNFIQILDTQVIFDEETQSFTITGLQENVDGEELGTEEQSLFTILKNLTPEQITKLKTKTDENGEVDAERGEKEHILYSLIEIIEPQQTDKIEVEEDVRIILKQFVQDDTNKDDAAAGIEAFVAQLNTLLVSIGERKQLIKDPFGDPNARLHSSYEGGRDSGYRAASPDLGNLQGEELKADMGAKTAPKNADLLSNASLSPLLAGMEPLAGNDSLFANLNYSDPVLDQLQTPTSFQAALNATAATSTVTTASAAHAPHPGTQAVAVTIKKAAQNAQSKSFTLQLEPPELGKVEVRMTFSADKKMKALVLSEKPETHLMLQRDANMLEKALQDSGLDSETGIEFELAEQGFDFDQNNQRGGGHDQGGTGAGDENDQDDILQATMTWHVDPETGHVRYNIVV